LGPLQFKNDPGDLKVGPILIINRKRYQIVQRAVGLFSTFILTAALAAPPPAPP
jgi:hypothetical protein